MRSRSLASVLATSLTAAVGGASGLGGCAMWANTGATAELQTGYAVAAQRAAVAETSVSTLEGRLDRLEDLLRRQGLTETGGPQSLEQLGAEVARLRGEIEVLQFGITGIRADLDQYMLDQERRQLHDEARLRALEALLGTAPPPPPRLDGAGAPVLGEAPDAPGDTGAPGGTAPGLGEEGTVDVAARLDLARERMEAGHQTAARVVLEQTLAAEPDHPLSSEVRYRLAETWFNEGKHKEAAKAFQRVTEDYPSSPWAPWAMLRIGECFEGMGRSDAADTFYEGVVRTYPEAEAAGEARERLRRTGR